MEGAASAKPGREPPPVPPNYVSLRKLQELRLKEKEEQEKRQREEEEAAAAAAAAKRAAEKAAMAAAIKREAALKAEAKRRREKEEAAAARREAEKAAMAAAIKREAPLKAEAKARTASWEASGGPKERHRGEQGHQWVAVAHRAPAVTPRPMARGHGAAGKTEAAIGGGRGEKGPADVPDNFPHGGGKPRVKGKGKEKLAEAAPASSHAGTPAEVVPASSHAGTPGNKSESKAKGKTPGDQAAESSSSGGTAGASILSSRDRFRRGRPTGAGGRRAEACTGIAPVKTAGPSPPRGVKSDGMGKPKPPAPRRADAVAGSDVPDGKKAAPAPAPAPALALPTSSADGSSKLTSGGDLRKTMEAKPGGLVEGQRRRQVVEVQAVAELNHPRVARCSGGPWRSRGNDAAEQHGRVWVPKTAAAAGSSAGAGL